MLGTRGGRGLRYVRQRRRQLADAPIGLTQLDAKPMGQPHQPLARPLEKLGVGREHHRLRLHRRVDHDASEVGRLQRRVRVAKQN